MLPSSSVNHMDFRRQSSSTAPGLLIITLFITTAILMDFYSRTVQHHCCLIHLILHDQGVERFSHTPAFVYVAGPAVHVLP